MNILFNAFINPHAQSGVEKKIYGEIKALESLGNDVWHFTFENSYLVLNHKGQKEQLFLVKDSMISYYLALEKGARQVCLSRDIHLMYVRRIFCTPFHLKTLSLLKKQSVKLVEELPTYPYDEESKNFKALSYKATAVVDRLTRGSYKKYLDYFVTFSTDKTIFGVPCINMENGIDFDNIRFSPTRFDDGEINLLAVSAMAPWHGYERLIEGLKNYYSADIAPPCIVNLHLVGEGQEKENWQALVKAYGLERHVKFHGHKTGAALNDIFDFCKLCAGSLGFYKIGLLNPSPLKIREYAAMGKPFIYSTSDEKLDNNQTFCKRVPNDASPIDIADLVEFYSRIKTVDNLSVDMNKFALENYSWETQMQKLMDKINK